MTINGLELKHIYIIKKGVVVLSNEWKEGNTEDTTPNFPVEWTKIDHDFKKATKSTKDNLIVKGTSFYLSTGNRDYSNNIIYDLYINEDIANIEQIEDYLSETRKGETNHQHQFQISFNCDITIHTREWVDIKEDEFNSLMDKYQKMGYFDARRNLLKNRFDYRLKEAQEERIATRWKSSVIKRCNEAIKNGYVASDYRRVEKHLRKLTINSYVYKTTYTEEREKQIKLTNELNKILIDSKKLYVDDVAELLKHFNITKKRASNNG